MNRFGMHHPTADVDRIYVWRGCGLLNLVNIWRATIVSIITACQAVAAETDSFLSVEKSFQAKLCQSKSLLPSVRMNTLHTILFTLRIQLVKLRGLESV